MNEQNTPENNEHENKKEEVGIPEELCIPRRYTMSEAAREARSKGGKARAKQCPAPNWKHGKYSKSFLIGTIRPCKTTCEQYPCEIIEEGSTKPGGPCLDKAQVIQTYLAIVDAIKNKNMGNFQEIAALTMAQSIQVINMLQEDIIRDGTIVKRKKYDKDGDEIGYEVVPHPSLLALPKLIADLGMTLPEFLTTPRSIAKQGTEEKGIESIGDLLAKISSNLQTKKEAQEKKDHEE